MCARGCAWWRACVWVRSARAGGAGRGRVCVSGAHAGDAAARVCACMIVSGWAAGRARVGPRRPVKLVRRVTCARDGRGGACNAWGDGRTFASKVHVCGGSGAAGECGCGRPAPDVFACGGRGQWCGELGPLCSCAFGGRGRAERSGRRRVCAAAGALPLWRVRQVWVACACDSEAGGNSGAHADEGSRRARIRDRRHARVRAGVLC